MPRRWRTGRALARRGHARIPRGAIGKRARRSAGHPSSEDPRVARRVSLRQTHGDGRAGNRIVSVVRTIGWRPTCECPPAEPVPCVVLDPFSGAGTTGLVALKHGRRFVGIDLNPAYVEIAGRRLREATAQFDLFPLRARRPAEARARGRGARGRSRDLRIPRLPDRRIRRRLPRRVRAGPARAPLVRPREPRTPPRAAARAAAAVHGPRAMLVIVQRQPWERQ